MKKLIINIIYVFKTKQARDAEAGHGRHGRRGGARVGVEQARASLDGFGLPTIVGLRGKGFRI